MRLKDLFSVPTGQKITEKHLRRVLVSSICSILLSMGCLVSVTWAWFVVSIENTGNVIQIGSPEIDVFVDDVRGETILNPSEDSHIVSLEHAGETDDLDQKSILYAVLTIVPDQEMSSDEPISVYTVLGPEKDYEKVEIFTEVQCELSWEASWIEPANAAPLTDECLSFLKAEKTLTASEGAGEQSEKTDEDNPDGADPSTEGGSEEDPSKDDGAETDGTVITPEVT